MWVSKLEMARVLQYARTVPSYLKIHVPTLLIFIQSYLVPRTSYLVPPSAGQISGFPRIFLFRWGEVGIGVEKWDN